MFQNTMGGGMNLGFPDVCLTPSPVGPVPIPYPNMSMGPTTIPPTTAMTVLTDFMPSCNLMSMTATSVGDSTGVAMGVASGMIMGPTHNVLGSFTVLKQGVPAARMTTMTMQNNTNCPGISLVPSQVTVLTLG
ncbi:MAG: type VI secretion protein [Deltaproteobacteria bacterium HGW-Deltaproteobacteria-15]|nr:MAG: type VI secretion protein [Deltaproteobacteria bacterium HGW-Deltaproteobacteria-15]